MLKHEVAVRQVRPFPQPPVYILPLPEVLDAVRRGETTARLLRVQTDLLLLIHDSSSGLSETDRESLRAAQRTVADVR